MLNGLVLIFLKLLISRVFQKHLLTTLSETKHPVSFAEGNVLLILERRAARLVGVDRNAAWNTIVSITVSLQRSVLSPFFTMD